MAITREYPLICIINSKIILFLAGILGVLVSLPNPLWSFPPGIFVSLAPLFILNRKIIGWHAIGINALFIFLVSIGTLIPLDIGNVTAWELQLSLLFFIFVFISLVYGVMLGVGTYLSSVLGWKYSPIFWGMGWSGGQYILSSVNFAFPFPVEGAIIPWVVFAQAANVFGAYSIGFLIISVNGLSAYLLTEKAGKRINWITYIVAAAFIANIIYGMYSLNFMPQRFKGKEVVAFVQPNLSSKEYAMAARSRLFENVFNQKIAFISKEALKRGARIIIWPELSGNYTLQNDGYLNRLYHEVTSKGAELLIGTSFIDYMKNRREYNIAFILDERGETTQPYRKMRLFPYFESSGYMPGEESVLLPTKTAFSRIGAMICLDSIYPSAARALVNQGAKVLVLISSDTAFGNSIIPYLHRNMLALRAIENNRFAVHVGNNGPSAVYDNKGRFLLGSSYGQAAFGVIAINGIEDKTIYNIIGDIFPFVCVVSFVGIGILNLIVILGKGQYLRR